MLVSGQGLLKLTLHAPTSDPSEPGYPTSFSGSQPAVVTHGPCITVVLKRALIVHPSFIKLPGQFYHSSQPLGGHRASQVQALLSRRGLGSTFWQHVPELFSDSQNK